MKIETRQTKAKEVVEDMQRRCESGRCCQRDLQTLESLKRIGDSPNPDGVDAVFRCKRTSIMCDECNNKEPQVVAMLGDQSDYDSSTAWICLDCLRKAVAACERQIADEALTKPGDPT